MRIRLYVAACYGLAAIALSGFVDAMPARAFDETVGGQLEAETDRGMLAASILHTSVDATIRGDRAEVHLHQVFSPLPAGTEAATFFLPLGDGARVKTIEIAQGTQFERWDPEGGTAPGISAPRMFSQQLQLTGASLVEITVLYTQPVRINEGVHTLVLPVANIPGGTFAPPILEAEYQDLQEYLCGEVSGLPEVSSDSIEIFVTLDQRALFEIYSDTHAIDVTAVEHGTIVELAPAVQVDNRTFVLSYVPQDIEATVVAQVDGSK